MNNARDIEELDVKLKVKSRFSQNRAVPEAAATIKITHVTVAVKSRNFSILEIFACIVDRIKLS